MTSITITNRDICSLIVFYLKVAALSALASFALYELSAVWGHINFGDLFYRELLIALSSLSAGEFVTVIFVLMAIGAFSLMIRLSARRHLLESKFSKVWIASVVGINLSLIAGLLVGELVSNGISSDWFHSVFRVVGLVFIATYVSSIGLMKVHFYRDASTREEDERKSKSK
jgi:hypothetical protein